MPDRLALMGDVHANAAALRAVLAAIEGAGMRRGVCTGDLVMRGDRPEECVDLVRRLGWPCVMGNTDRKVATRQRRPPDHPKAQRVGSRPWTTNQLSEPSLAYLADLPMVARLEVRGALVVVMHGSPTDPREAIDGDTPGRDLRRLARDLGRPACVVSGHTHVPLVRDEAGCLFVNPGAVGEALDGDRRPRWAWLEVGRAGLRAHLETVPEELARIRDN
ncbi:metallophosphoesterase family protein [Miltoncostaea marina]|uniref:metallophosphoesterase family protein n=1 Tax=Miltoncostaea marina TaxID=2843215 RepID=UPI001C3CC818|nr:metallophosphoesterase family protein [Miltoncostaea marina]